MPRHSKNNTANPIFTYHERKNVKDVGTLKERLGKDSMRKFEQCWICLRNAEYPVSTPYGHIFCKMCIISNLLTQKKVYTQKKKEYNDYIKELKKKKKDEANYEKEKEKRKFIEDLESINDNEKDKKEKKENLLDISNNFWLSNNSKVKKDAIQKKLKPPSKNLICPISKNPIKISDLITINPEVLNKKDSTKENWVCSFSKKNIDYHKAVLIKKTGQIILKSFFESYIYNKKNSWEISVGEGDFIDLQPGGTAFCSHSNVEKTLYREPLL
ncbi:conserved protein, unknown function [Plasmodium relictum]|uniref:Nitric oxide synthase-interacting protein zinc-finger domain-containing protein n=1 Tax=Plasmodium relictum TaxID=85471 RepID=A0A1J1H6S7_PLARL|nr:conserved protein, unknown function [Plasmodium relictum]CRH00484.1 conserved protein, unknown function [Plasmodium relictum]